MKKACYLSLFCILSISCNRNPQTSVELSTKISRTSPNENTTRDLQEITTACIQTIFEIIKRSSHYKKILAHHSDASHLKFQVITSPNPKVDQAKFQGDYYEIEIVDTSHESEIIMGAYRFSRHEKQLYVHNITNNEYEWIEIDTASIKDFESICGNEFH